MVGVIVPSIVVGVVPFNGVAVDADEEAEGVLMEATIGVPRAQPGKWASCIRVVDPLTKQTLSVLELAENEAVHRSGIEPGLYLIAIELCSDCGCALMVSTRRSRWPWCPCATGKARRSQWWARSRT